MLVTKDIYENRRLDPRVPCLVNTFFVDEQGNQHRTEVLNRSRGGAKITTHKKIRVGDRFQLLEQERNGKETGVLVEVRWAASLPGNVRLVVGVKKMVV